MRIKNKKLKIKYTSTINDENKSYMRKNIIKLKINKLNKQKKMNVEYTWKYLKINKKSEKRLELKLKFKKERKLFPPDLR